jgi:hypothetical protein
VRCCGRPRLIAVAKNVALAGVKTVTIYDPSPVEIADLGTQVGSGKSRLIPVLPPRGRRG